MYLAQCTRPDISFSITNLSQFNKNPGTAHWKAVRRLMRYLKATSDAKLVCTKDDGGDDLHGYADSDWASSFKDFKSCTGYVFLWQGAAVTWASKKQPTVALSTCEAEYMSLSAATQEALWLNQLKDEIINSGMTTIELRCDNKGAVDLTDTGTYSPRVKHIAIRHHFIRDYVEKHLIEITKVNTGEMVADNLTKAVSVEKHLFCSKKMGLRI